MEEKVVALLLRHFDDTQANYNKAAKDLIELITTQQEKL